MNSHASETPAPQSNGPAPAPRTPAAPRAPTPTPASEGEGAPAGGRRYAPAVVGSLVLLVAAVLGYRHWVFIQAHEETDDAQVEGHVSPVIPRLAGAVKAVLVDDNQLVRAGDVVVEIDPSEADLRVRSAEAALANANAAHVTAVAALADARASAAAAAAAVRTAEIAARKAAADLRRDSALLASGAITQSQLDDTQAAADRTASQVDALRRQAEASDLQVPVTDARITETSAAIARAQSDVASARLMRSYASVTAPIGGRVSRKAVEPGQVIEAGQVVLSIASEDAPWLVANFKETQLGSIHAGQPATFTVDAYPGTVFTARVDSLAGATGARFALLPPDNASGNFVKVTQRVPVKLVPAGPADPARPLRPGMSVDVTVSTLP